ncbi:MAG TPA: reactive intermediate/imine deaminase, partial [Campylobacterales bacterium]|nr:reactive intermediate/imine deaminase [Campylobacterales bacterium]
GDMVYTAGQIPLTPEGELIKGDIHDQARQTLVNLNNVLEAAGSSLDQVVKTTIYLTDMDNFLAVNTVYAEFFVGSFPARSTVAVKTLPMNVDIEIEAVAVASGQDYTY